VDHKRTWCRAYVMSVLPPKAAIRQRDWRVRYVPRPDVLRVGTKLLVPQQAGLEPMAVRVSTMTPSYSSTRASIGIFSGGSIFRVLHLLPASGKERGGLISEEIE
jgi:hypothetical protein